MQEKMRYNIGLMGSAGRGKTLPQHLLQKAREVGREIARNGCTLVTGACMGVPHEAVLGAREEDGIVLGFSPAANLKEHIEPPISYPMPPEGMILVYTGIGKEGRIVLTIMNCDAAIFCAGYAGTLNEFASAYQRGKIIGILKGSGGIADKLVEIAAATNKDTGAVLIEEANPKVLVSKVIEAVKKREKAQAFYDRNSKKTGNL